MSEVAAKLEFSAVLQLVLSLPARDQRQLVEVMTHVTGHMALPGAPITAEALAQAVEAAVEPPTVSAAQWLTSMAGESAWTKLQLIDEVLLEMAEDDDERQLLVEARRALLEENPPLSVRRAVYTAASQHPLYVVFGVCGLVLAVMGVFRALARIVF